MVPSVSTWAAATTAATLTEAELRIVVRGQEEESAKTPVAIIFGWGGSSHKNVSKYSAIYHRAGCITVQYVLATRHLFRDTQQIPDIMEHLLARLEELQLASNPTYIHCLCDTGVMCYQGLDIAMARTATRLNIQGVVWDSCPGPYPEVTLVRYTVFTAIFLLCCLRDWTNGDTTVTDFLHSAYFIIAHRIIPSIKKKLEGVPITFGLIKGVWAGHFARDHCLERRRTPELFLYSNNDYYLSYHYLEQMVLGVRERLGAPFRAVRFDGSPHVGHLRYHRHQYTQEIQAFVQGSSKMGRAHTDDEQLKIEKHHVN